MSTKSNIKRKSRTGLYAAIAIIVIIIVVGIAVAFVYTRPGSSSSAIKVTLYAGEIRPGTYGFGNSSSVTSPGPTLTFKEGQAYTVTVDNVGTMLHSWEINTQNSTNGQVLFNSDINSGTYISPGQSASVTFTPNQTGNFYYICPVPGHASSFGMWGNVVVTS
jgi:uncharacterized cupredoxin-like copper-binding protein